MLRTSLLALVAALVAQPAGFQAPGSEYPAPGYVQVWADEFTTDGAPDPKHWTFENGFVRNQELQRYQPENARVLGGQLVIEARRERVKNPRYEAGSADWRRAREFAEYTSSSLMTVT